jgi:rRNA-processing protein FCF1
MKKVILDTDFIINCLKNKIDILEELRNLLDINYKVYIIDKTIDELKNKPLENLAKKFVKKVSIIQTKKDKSVDDLVLEQKDAIVATQDKGLKEKLKKAKIPIITIRQKKYLKCFTK